MAQTHHRAYIRKYNALMPKCGFSYFIFHLTWWLKIWYGMVPTCGFFLFYMPFDVVAEKLIWRGYVWLRRWMAMCLSCFRQRMCLLPNRNILWLKRYDSFQIRKPPSQVFSASLLFLISRALSLHLSLSRTLIEVTLSVPEISGTGKQKN